MSTTTITDNAQTPITALLLLPHNEQPHFDTIGYVGSKGVQTHLKLIASVASPTLVKQLNSMKELTALEVLELAHISKFRTPFTSSSVALREASAACPRRTGRTSELARLVADDAIWFGWETLTGHVFAASVCDVVERTPYDLSLGYSYLGTTKTDTAAQKALELFGTDQANVYLSRSRFTQTHVATYRVQQLSAVHKLAQLRAPQGARRGRCENSNRGAVVEKPPADLPIVSVSATSYSCDVVLPIHGGDLVANGRPIFVKRGGKASKNQITPAGMTQLALGLITGELSDADRAIIMRSGATLATPPIGGVVVAAAPPESTSTPATPAPAPAKKSTPLARKKRALSSTSTSSSSDTEFVHCPDGDEDGSADEFVPKRRLNKSSRAPAPSAPLQEKVVSSPLQVIDDNLIDALLAEGPLVLARCAAVQESAVQQAPAAPTEQQQQQAPAAVTVVTAQQIELKEAERLGAGPDSVSANVWADFEDWFYSTASRGGAMSDDALTTGLKAFEIEQPMSGEAIYQNTKGRNPLFLNEDVGLQATMAWNKLDDAQ